MVLGSGAWWQIVRIHENFRGRPGKYGFETKNVETGRPGSMEAHARLRFTVR